jgi:hypothetical protein
MIEHLPAETPTAYRVTVLDLERGRVALVFGPLKAPSERMPGTRLQQVFAPDGDKLYTRCIRARVPDTHHTEPPSPAVHRSPLSTC